MLSFIAANLATILIGAVVFAILALIVVKLFRTGKSTRAPAPAAVPAARARSNAITASDKRFPGRLPFLISRKSGGFCPRSSLLAFAARRA
jgi:hypothetical protein